jgi:hypothetical protein
LIRRICASESKNNSFMATPPRAMNESSRARDRKDINGSWA